MNKGADTKRQLAKEVLRKELSRSQVIPRNRNSGETRLTKGQKVQHITGVPINKLRDDQIYVTGNDYDNKMYEAFLGMRLKSKGFNPQKVVMDLKVDVKAPSSKDQFRLFKRFSKDNKKLIDSSIERWLEEKGKDVRVASDDKGRYDQFINSLEKKSLARTEFYRALKDSGYNAVLDEHDITGSWMQAQKSLIIMDTLGTIGDFKIEDLTIPKLEAAVDDWVRKQN